MTATLTRVRRAIGISALLVVSVTGTAWAGCPPVDIERCELMHQDWPNARP